MTCEVSLSQDRDCDVLVLLRRWASGHSHRGGFTLSVKGAGHNVVTNQIFWLSFLGTRIL